MKKKQFENLAVKDLTMHGFLERGFEMMCNHPDVASVIHEEHVNGTPKRAVDALLEMIKGVWENPLHALDAMFDGKKYDEVVYVNDISFVSMCAHHFLPFFGKAHFAYLPKEHIVGLSKIPRLVECYSRRPQIQEKLGQDIVDTFMQVVQPWGCGIIIEAWHLCMMIRGVNQRPAYTKTTALRGSFKSNVQLRQEFLLGVRKTTEQLWP